MNVVVRSIRRIMSAQSSLAAVAYTLVSKVGVLGLNFATGVIMARTLGPDGRGATSAVALWPLLLSGVATLGIPVALRYTIRRKLDDGNRLFSVALVLTIVCGSIAGLIGFALVPHWLSHYSPAVVQFGRLMLLFTPIMSINLLLQGYLESQGLFARSGSMWLIPPVGTLVALIALYFFHAINVFSVPLAYEVPFSGFALLMLFRVRGALRKPTQFVSRSRLLFDFGLRAYGLDVLNTLSAQIGQVLVVGLLSAASFGLYAVALNVSRTLFILGASLNTVLFPKASELDHAEAVSLVKRSARVGFAVNLIGGILLIAGLPFLMRLAYGAAYSSAIPLAQVLTFEVVLGATTNTLLQAFMSTGKPGIVTIFQAVGLGTTIPLMFVLLPRYGIMGAAYALLASTALRLVLVLGSFPVFLKEPVPRLLLTSTDVQEIRLRLTRAIA